jgi:carbon storage regulator CsrA
MFILTRRPGETIVIDGKIQVLKAHGRKVSLGITAPKSVRVDRSEVHQFRSGRAEFAPDRALPGAALLAGKLEE